MKQVMRWDEMFIATITVCTLFTEKNIYRYTSNKQLLRIYYLTGIWEGKDNCGYRQVRLESFSFGREHLSQGDDNIWFSLKIGIEHSGTENWARTTGTRIHPWGEWQGWWNWYLYLGKNVMDAPISVSRGRSINPFLFADDYIAIGCLTRRPWLEPSCREKRLGGGDPFVSFDKQFRGRSSDLLASPTVQQRSAWRCQDWATLRGASSSSSGIVPGSGSNRRRRSLLPNKPRGKRRGGRELQLMILPFFFQFTALHFESFQINPNSFPRLCSSV